MRVVNIDQKDFNSQMDNYISDRRDKYSGSIFQSPKIKADKPTFSPFRENVKSLFDKLFSGSKVTKEEAEMLEGAGEEEKSAIREIEEIEAEIEEADHVEEVVEERKEALFTRLFKKMGLLSRPESFEEDVIGVPEGFGSEDIKEVLKVLHKWLEELPDHKKAAFKESDDFHLYKSTLKKYGLIK